MPGRYWSSGLSVWLIALVAVALSAQVQIPMVPVPMTLQTLVLFVAAARLGPGRAAALAAAYLGLGVAGVPVFADWKAAMGSEFLDLKSAGYILGFVPAAALVGWFAETAPGRRLAGFGVMLMAHLVVVTAGIAWLSRFLPLADAIRVGGTPFLLGMVVKSAVAAWLLPSAPHPDP